MANARPAAHYLHAGGGVVIVPARVAAYLNTYAKLEQFRRDHRGQDAEVDEVLVAFLTSEKAWRSSVLGTRPAALPEPAPNCSLTTVQAANRLGITDRGVRKAIATGHLKAESVNGRWEISLEQLQHFRATRPRVA